MKITIQSPTDTFKYRDIEKVVFYTENGMITILENHCNYITSMLPGHIAMMDDDMSYRFCGTGGGIVYVHDEVIIMTYIVVKREEIICHNKIQDKIRIEDWNILMNNIELEWCKPNIFDE